MFWFCIFRKRFIVSASLYWWFRVLSRLRMSVGLRCRFWERWSGETATIINLAWWFMYLIVVYDSLQWQSWIYVPLEVRVFGIFSLSIAVAVFFRPVWSITLLDLGFLGCGDELVCLRSRVLFNFFGCFMF